MSFGIAQKTDVKVSYAERHMLYKLDLETPGNSKRSSSCHGVRLSLEVSVPRRENTVAVNFV